MGTRFNLNLRAAQAGIRSGRYALGLQPLKANMRDPQDDRYAGAIQRAADLAGGIQAVAENLGVLTLLLRACINGHQNTPTGLFLKVVDFLLAYGVGANAAADDAEPQGGTALGPRGGAEA